jgi:EmrB/QacA subfamily drug resistance transporter
MITRTTPQDTVSQAVYPRRWAAATVMMVAALMDLIDATIVNVALPTIRRDLSASGPAIEWVVSAYLLAFAAALITAGRVGDMIGRKRLFLIGVVTFGLASLACGIARSPGELIAARAVAGTAAAIMIPQVLATFRTIFAGRERGAAFGLYGAMGGIATAGGLLLGGVLTSANVFGWGWRTIFAVNIPVALATLVAAIVVVPETRSARPQRPDLTGMALIAAGLVAIVYPLLEGQALGWPAWSFGCLAAGAAAIAWVAGSGRSGRRQRSGVAPLLPAGLLRRPAFTAGLLVQLAFAAGLQGFSLILALWLQSGQHYSPVRAGVTTVAFSVGAFLTAGLSIQLAARLGRTILVAGALMMAGGMYGVLIAAQHSATGVDPWQLVPGLVVAGAGLGFLVVPLINVVLAAAPAELAGGASGVFNTAQQLGGAIGVAVTGSVFFARLGTAGFTAAFTHAVPLAIGAFAVCAVLSLVLPRTAVSEAYE